MYPSDLDADQRSRIDQHLKLVLEANKTTNITRIESLESAEVLHIEDSLAAYQECLQAPEGRYADIGSGAGYPGIPMAIATGRETVLVESVKKKADLLNRFSRELGLSPRVAVYAGRAEELAADQPESFSLVTARALTALPSLLELAAPLLSINGQLVAYKARSISDELAWAESIQDKLGMKLVSQRPVLLSDGETQRTILVYQKVSEPQVKLPRRPGMAQKRPYRQK